jgi:hypothetical protein
MATHKASLNTNRAVKEAGGEISPLRTYTVVINAVIFESTSTIHSPTPSVVMSHVIMLHLFLICIRTLNSI